MPKKKEGGGTPTAIANMSASEASGGGGDLGNTSLILSTHVNRASTPQPLHNGHLSVSDSNHSNNNQNPSETTSGISSNTSSGSSLNKKVTIDKFIFLVFIYVKQILI